MVDVTASDLILAKIMDCDAVLSHHPIGVSLLNFHRVIDRQLHFMKECGIPSGVARKPIIDLRSKIKMKTHSQIYSSVTDCARLLNLSLMNIHQPCDEYTRKVVTARINKKKPRSISVLVKVLEEIRDKKCCYPNRRSLWKFKQRYLSTSCCLSRWHKWRIFSCKDLL